MYATSIQRDSLPVQCRRSLNRISIISNSSWSQRLRYFLNICR